MQPRFPIWVTAERCRVGDISFRTLPTDILETERPSLRTDDDDFLLLKTQPLVDRYAELVAELSPRYLVELGILEGGSTAFLHELALPERLVAVDQKPPAGRALDEYLARNGLEDRVRIYDDVDQADRRRLAEIVDECFGDNPLDLVADDCSHLYGATRASFNELFPRLRPGGVYVIEDWAWAHVEPLDRMWADEVPLTRLVFELMLAIPAVPGLIEDLTVDGQVVRVTRGPAKIDPHGFEVSNRSNERGLGLLRTLEPDKGSGNRQS